MRKVLGEEITIKELKECYFGYSEKVWFDKIVETIEVNGRRYTVSEGFDYIICYPVELDSEFFADAYKVKPKEQYNITVWKFITNWWGLDEIPLEDFIFYFTE